MGPLGFAEAKPGSWIERMLEERFQIRFIPLFLDPVAYSKTRPLKFIAGEIPDIFWDGDPLGVQSKARHGFVLEIPIPLILKHAPNYVKYVNTYAPEAWMYPSWGGRNWGLPTVIPHARQPSFPLWRKDWLDRVGIKKVPQTMEEYHEAFRRFTYNDPDGNGRNDTYGFSPPVAHWSYYFVEFFAAEGVLPFDVQEVDGKMTWGGIRPEAREVLEMLRQWYAEGLINPDFVLGQAAMSEQHLLDGKSGYLAMQGYPAFSKVRQRSLHHRLIALHPEAELVPGEALAGSDGVQRVRVWGAGGHILQFSRHLSREPEKVIRVLKMLDTLVQEDALRLSALMGERGLHWDYSPERGTWSLEPYTEVRATREMLHPDAYERLGFYMVSGLPPEQVRAYHSDAKRIILDRYARPEWGISNALGKSDVLAESAARLGDLRQLQQKFYTDLIRGIRPMEDFETFVRLWHERGGEALLKEAEDFVVRRNDLYHQLGVSPSTAP